MKTQMKNVVFLLVIMLMIFSRSISAQTVLTIQGNVSDLTGNPIANQDVYFSDDTTSMNMAMAITDVNGDYTGVLTTLLSQGILFVATEDCNQNLILNTHPFSLNTQMITSNFVICTSSTTTPCTLSGASVHYDSLINQLVASLAVGTPPPNFFTFLWDNGITTSMVAYYPNWCVTIMDANGCDTTICDTSSITQPCILSGAYVSSSPNGLTAGIMTMPPNAITYIWSNGTVGNWSSFYQNWCVQIIDSVSGCDTMICDTSTVVSTCQADFTSTQVSPSDSTFFTSLSSGTNASTSYFWDFGDNSTSTDQNPIHLYVQSGWYYVCLTIMDSTTNCYDTYCDLINVVVAGGSGCQAYFYSTPALIQVVNSFNFYDMSSGNAANWLWDFGDGTTSTQQNPAHTYSPTATGFFLVCLTIEEYDPVTQALICTDTYCDSIYIINQPSSCQADFYAQDLGNNEAIFTNTSYPQTGATWFGFAEVNIDFGDGTNAFNIGGTINHTYPNDGTYYVCIEVVESDSSGNILCTDTYCDSVTVTSGTMPCQAAFCAIQDSTVIITQNPNGTTTTTIGDAFFFCDLSTPVNNIQSWQWDMGDNGAGQYLQNTSSTSQMPVYEYDTNGVYYVCLTIVTTGGQCTSITCDSVDFSMMQGQTAINEVNTFEGLKLFPNPANDKLTVNLISNTNGNLSIRLVNMMGQTLSYENITIFNGAINHSLDVSEIGNGVYSVEVVLDGEKQYQRVVISR